MIVTGMTGSQYENQWFMFRGERPANLMLHSEGIKPSQDREKLLVICTNTENAGSKRTELEVRPEGRNALAVTRT